MAEMKIEVPINVTGDKSVKDIGKSIADQIKKSLDSIGIGKAKGGIGGSNIGKGIGKLAGVFAAGTIALKVLTLAIDGLSKLFRPLVKILEVLFFLIFLPLLPLIKTLTEALGNFVKDVAKEIKSLKAKREEVPVLGKALKVGEDESFFLKLGKNIANLALDLGIVIGDVINAIIDFGANIVLGALDLGVKIGDWLLEKVIEPAAAWIVTAIQNSLAFLKNLGVDIWNFFIKSLDSIKDLGNKIWDLFKNALSGIGDLGNKIWNIIKGALSSLNPFGGKNSRKVNDAIITPQGVINTNPNDYIIATKDPSSLGGKGITININNPSVRNDQDLKKIANQVSRVLQRQTTGRFS